MIERKLLNPKQVTEKIGISYSTLLRKVKENAIPHVKVGSKLLFPASYFEELEAQAYKNYKGGSNE